MPDHDQRGNGRRGGSLLSASGSGQRRPSGLGSGSLLSADEDQNAVLQHKLARSRREAKPNPLLHALAARPDPERQTDADVEAEVTASLDSDIDVPAAMNERAARRNANQPPENAMSAANDDHHNHRNYDEKRHEDPYRPLIDPITVFNGIKRSKRLIATTTIIGAFAGVVIALATPKKYESVAEILVDPRNIQIVDRELVKSDVSPNTAIAIVENQMRIITSSMVVSKVVDRLNLGTDPEFNGSTSGFQIPNLIGELRSLLARRDGQSGSDRSRRIATQSLLESLKVERGGKTFVVSVSVNTQNAEKSALVANTIVDAFLENSGEFASSAAGRAASELGGKLEQLRSGVEAAERKVETFKGEHDLIDARGRLIGDDEIIKINDQLATARAKTIELSARAASARSIDVNSAIGGALPEGINSNLITELRSQYAVLLQQSSQRAIKLGSKHPENRAIQAQLEGAREQLKNEIRRIVASMQVELKRAVELEQKLSARLAALKARQVNVSDDMVTLRELERNAGAKRAVYESYLLRARETSEQTDLNPANISLISPAFAPLDPVGPSRSMISIAGMLAGFLLGIGIGGVRGAADGLFGGNPPSGSRGRRGTGSPSSPNAGPLARGRRRAAVSDDHSEDTYPGQVAQAPDDGRTSIGQPQHPPWPPTGPGGPQVAFSPPPGYPSPAPVYPYAPTYMAPQIYPMPGMMAQATYPMPMPSYPAAMFQPAIYPQPVFAGAHHPPVGDPANGEQMPANTGNDLENRAAPPPQPDPGETRHESRPAPKDNVERIRDDLRDMRGAIYDLAEKRSRRRK